MSDTKQKEVDMKYWMTQLKNGNVPALVSDETPILLKKKEELIVTLPNISFWQPRTAGRTTGGHGGASFRIAKGVYSETDQAIFRITVGNRVYREPFSGLILMYHIEGLRKKLE